MTSTRREALTAAGATGVALLFSGRFDLAADPAQAVSATCTMTPAKTEGPYFVDEKLRRSDIRAGQAGTPLTLTMYVFDAAKDCAPVSGAQVDIWHANADGKYSDEAANGTAGETWLRGYQVTDADGKVTFTTVWPGWYQGRAVHIHFKVRATGLEFTSQLFFTDAMNTAVFKREPYASRGDSTLKDASDGIYGTDGSSLLLHPTASDDGYAADFSVGLASAAADTTVSATLTSVKAVRLASGARQARVRLRPDEPVVATVRITRAGGQLARRRVTLTAGSHTLRLPIGRAVTAGGARVTVTLTDAARNSRTYTRTVHVPKRKAA